MTERAAKNMDENTRRYYLDAMGIQCWESLDAQPGLASSLAENSDGEVSVASEMALETSIQTCTNCTLHTTRKQAIAGRGNQHGNLMFVLLSPTAGDDNNNLVCSGEAGELFSKMLAAININIDDVYITSLLKCAVPANHAVSAQEIQSCESHLQQQIQQVQPELLVVLGETVARYLLQQEQTIDDCRAMNQSLTQQFASLPLFFSYSPEELLLQPENKRKAWTDLQQLQKIIEKNN